MIDIQDMVRAMNNHYPAKANSDYEAVATKYVELCVNELLMGVSRRKADDAQDVCRPFLTNIKNAMQDRYNRTQYWYTWLTANYPLWIKITGGYKNGKSNPSVVRLLCSQSELLHYRVTNTFKYTTPKPSADATNTVELNWSSLRNFADNQYHWITNAKPDQDIRKLTRKLTESCRLLDYIAQYGTTLRYETQSRDYTRTYHIGLNLQNCNSGVREAALGDARKVDIRTAMYVYYKQQIQKHTTYNPTYIKEMIECKSGIREQLAKQLTNTAGPVEWKANTIIKPILSGIAFGADANNSYTKIFNDIWNPDDRERIKNHPWILGLQQDIAMYNCISEELYPKDMVKREFPEALKTVTGKRYGERQIFNRNSFNTYLYRQWESAVMQIFRDLIEQTNPDSILLDVHDCFYLSKAVSMDTIRTAQYDMQCAVDPDLHFECDNIRPVMHNKLMQSQDANQNLLHSIKEELGAYIYTEVWPANSKTEVYKAINMLNPLLKNLGELDPELIKQRATNSTKITEQAVMQFLLENHYG